MPICANHCPSLSIRAIAYHLMPSLSFWGTLCYSMPSCVNPSNPCQAVSIRAIRAKLCQSHRHHSTRVVSSSPSAVFSAPLVACSSATPSQLCDTISALRHHLSSATPSQLCDTISFPDRKTTLSVPKALVATMHEAAYDSSDRLHRLRTSELVSCGPRRHSNRPRHLLGFVAVVVKTAEVASEVISEVIIAVDARLPHYGRVHCSHGEAVACPTRRVSTSALADH